MMSLEKQWRLLVCEPDPLGQKLIQEYLQDSAVKVFFSAPFEPLENTLTEHSPFNAVVFDLSSLAKRSYDDLVGAVKRVAPGAEVIFMSRVADEMLWSQVLAIGAYDLLPKPLERDEFLRTVYGAVHHDRAA